MSVKESSALVLLSGGIDSTVLLYYVRVVLGYSNVETLAFDYGQSHKIELVYAERIAYENHVPHKVIKVDLTQFGGSSLISEEKEFSVVVPARNSIFLSMAAAYAETRNLQDIFIGCNATDFVDFPDCREQFIEAISQALSMGNNIRGVYAPLVNRSKKDVVRLGHLLDVPFDLTWSCYSPTLENKPCGKCNACKERNYVL